MKCTKKEDRLGFDLTSVKRPEMKVKIHPSNKLLEGQFLQHFMSKFYVNIKLFFVVKCRAFSVVEVGRKFHLC